MAVIQGTLLDEGGAVYNVKAYGLLGDNSPGDGAALATLLGWIPADSTLLFPSGTYFLENWDVFTLDKRLRFEASEPGVVLKGPTVRDHFVKIQADLELKGITFESWHTVLVGQGSGTVDSVRVSDCRATSALFFLDWTWSGSEKVRKLVVEGCHFEGLTLGVLYGSMNADEIIVRNNTIINCVRYGCRFISGQVETGPQGRGRLLFQGNYVRNLHQGTFLGDDAVARVVQVSAERVELVSNYVRDVATLGKNAPNNNPQGGANFAYVTTARLYAAGNLCWDVGSPGTSSAIIHEKNHDAYGAQVIGNSFIQSESNTATADAIQLTGDNVLVDGVHAVGLRGAVVATDRVDGGVISNVLASGHRGVIAILVLGGRDIHVESPSIRGHVNTVNAGQPRGIVIQSRNDAVPLENPAINDVTNIRVSNPMIRDVKGPNTNSGVGVHVYCVAGTMRRIAIHGGSIMGCDRAFELSENWDAVLEDVEILDTDMRENRLAIVNNTMIPEPDVQSPPPNPSARIIVRDSQGYRTENRGTATLAAGGTSVAVAHGLARAPLPGGISVTPAGNLGAASRFWADTVTATHFTIRTDAAPGGTGVPFAWQADAEEV